MKEQKDKQKQKETVNPIRHFFIDYENILYNGVRGISKINGTDKVYIFFTENANKLDFELYNELIKVHASLEIIKVSPGANSLDFQLSTFLGSVVTGHEQDQFYIVSKDHGYKAVVDFWACRGIKIHQVNNMQMENDRELIRELEERLPDYKADVPEIVSMLVKYKTKQGLNNALTKKFGTTKTGIITKAIRPYTKDKAAK